MDKVSSHVVRKVCQDEFELLRGNAALSVFAEHLRIYIDQLLSLLYNICSILNVVTFNAFSNQSFFSYHFCQEHYHFANLERFLVTSLVVDLKVLLQHHLVVTHLVTLAFVIRIWPNMLILGKYYLSPKR